MRKTLISLAMLVLIGTGVGVYLAFFTGSGRDQTSKEPSGANQVETAPEPKNEQPKFHVFADNLDTPWAMAFLPNGDMLVTERGGDVRQIGENDQTLRVNNVDQVDEGGLLGLALSPDFKTNRELYLYMTTSAGGELHNQVNLYSLKDNKLTFKRTIINNIPAARFHDGGRLEFGPDGKLYVTTGDASQSNLAQDKNSLAGKVLRVNPDGSTPADNPFGNLVWSYGHRNPEGITWDNQGRMWETEHGPTGSQGSGDDEINLIKKGGNYGWPVIRGNQAAKGMISPVIESGSSTTWAPAGIAYARGSLFFAGLRGQTLFQAVISKDGSLTPLKKHFADKYGRLRAVIVKDGVLYFSTSNRDGRGSPQANDDHIYAAPLSMFGL